MPVSSIDGGVELVSVAGFRPRFFHDIFKFFIEKNKGFFRAVAVNGVFGVGLVKQWNLLQGKSYFSG